jgi:hypothetical protein
VRNTFFVPVRESKAGTLALRTGRLGSGKRVGLAFTSAASLALTMGPSQRWVRLDGEALEEMLRPLGVVHVRVDLRRAGRSAPVRIRAAGTAPAAVSPQSRCARSTRSSPRRQLARSGS